MVCAGSTVGARFGRPRADRHGPMTRCRPLRAALALAAVTALGAGCSSSAAKPTAAPTTVATTTSATTVAQVDAAVIGQWSAAEKASVAAAKNPTDKTQQLVLVDYFVDPELSSLRTQYAAMARDGLNAVGDIDHGAPRVKSVSAAQAVVTSCTTNRLAEVFRATGKPLEGAVGSTAPVLNGVTSTLVLQPSGVWKISTSTVKDGSCEGL